MANSQAMLPGCCFLNRPADEKFSEEKVGDPAEPGDDDVGGAERPVQGEEHQGKIVAESDGGKGEGEVANHPAAVRGDIAAADGAIGFESGSEPEDGEKTKTEVRRQAFLGDEGHGNSTERAEQDFD